MTTLIVNKVRQLDADALGLNDPKIIWPADTDVWPAPQWARPRYFAGFTKRAIVGPATDTARFVTFRCLFVPTRRTHGGAFGFCYGPYATRAEARAAAEIHGLPVYDARASRS